MGTDISVVNAGKFAKPMNTLIEKIANATGVIYEPTKIRRKAKAEADAAKTKALVDLEIEEIQKRALNRLVNEEIKKQENIEAITEKSFDSIKENASPENIEDDWISNFFDKCKLISDEDMQKLWGKVLAGEANTPGKHSKRTIEFMTTMDRYDAEIFNKLSHFCWIFDDIQPIILNHKDKETNKLLSYNELTHLESIGLITTESFGLVKLIANKIEAICFYKGRQLNIKASNSKNYKVNIGIIALTKIGQDLMSIILDNQNYESSYYDSIITSFYKQGFILSESLENRYLFKSNN